MKISIMIEWISNSRESNSLHFDLGDFLAIRRNHDSTKNVPYNTYASMNWAKQQLKK